MAKLALTFSGFSGSGKTTLLLKVISILSKEYKIAALKHDGHGFTMDKEGKDTYKMKESGAQAIAIASPSKYALIADSKKRLTFNELASILPRDIELILGEGFKDDDIEKILVHRKANNKPSLYNSERNIIAVATDDFNLFPNIENLFDINDDKSIAAFIKGRIKE